jgi:hypothetical protein
MAQSSYKRRWNIRVEKPVKEFCEGKQDKYLRKNVKTGSAQRGAGFYSTLRSSVGFWTDVSNCNE